MRTVINRSLASLKESISIFKRYVVSLLLAAIAACLTGLRNTLSLLYLCTVGAVLSAFKALACGVLIVACMAGTLVIRSRRRVSKYFRRRYLAFCDVGGGCRDVCALRGRRCLAAAADALLYAWSLVAAAYVDYARPACASIAASTAILAATGAVGFIGLCSWDYYAGRADVADERIAVAVEYFLFGLDAAYWFCGEVGASLYASGTRATSWVLRNSAFLGAEATLALVDLVRLAYAVVRVTTTTAADVGSRSCRHACSLAGEFAAAMAEASVTAYPYVARGLDNVGRGVVEAADSASIAAVEALLGSRRALAKATAATSVYAGRGYAILIAGASYAAERFDVGVRIACRLAIYAATDGRVALFQHLDDIYTGYGLTYSLLYCLIRIINYILIQYHSIN